MKKAIGRKKWEEQVLFRGTDAPASLGIPTKVVRSEDDDEVESAEVDSRGEVEADLESEFEGTTGLDNPDNPSCDESPSTRHRKRKWFYAPQRQRTPPKRWAAEQPTDPSPWAIQSLRQAEQVPPAEPTPEGEHRAAVDLEEKTSSDSGPSPSRPFDLLRLRVLPK